MVKGVKALHSNKRFFGRHSEKLLGLCIQGSCNYYILYCWPDLTRVSVNLLAQPLNHPSQAG